MTLPLKSLGRLFGIHPLPDLDARLNTILPEKYQDRFEEVEPVSMGSAALRYDAGGKVAWDEMWGSFCNLAMAGGPPHKGTLLEPGSAEQIAQEPRLYREVVDQACRGIRMVSPLAVDLSPDPRWLQLWCESEAMAHWMLRAITVENVSVRCAADSILLPVGPHYRIAKEIKNLVTVTAKTTHYWLYHMSLRQHLEIADLFRRLEEASPLLEPSENATASPALAAATSLPPSDRSYAGWQGVVCPDVKSAVWIMRSLVACNVLSRREETTVFLPLDLIRDPDGAAVMKRFEAVHRMARDRGLL